MSVRVPGAAHVAANPWWPEFYSEKYLPTFAETFSKDDSATEQEVAALERLLPAPPARVLDAGCGRGRHALGLARAGYAVTGLDQGQRLIAEAQARAADAGLLIDFVVGDLVKHPWRDRFDAVISMYTAFGYCETPEEDIEWLAAYARALRIGGMLVLELRNRDYVVAHYKGNFWFEAPDGTTVRVQRAFDSVTGLNTVTEYWSRPDGVTGERFHRIRLYTASELDRSLRAARLRAVGWYGDFSMAPLTRETRHLIVVARKEP